MRPPHQLVLDAEEYARAAHATQVDKAGRPYVEHLDRVANDVMGVETACVAWLHDIIEDGHRGYAQLIRDGFPRSVADSVALLTKAIYDFGYDRYIERVARSGDYVAIAVKIADLVDHLRDLPPHMVASHESRYRNALVRLRSCYLPECHLGGGVKVW